MYFTCPGAPEAVALEGTDPRYYWPMSQVAFSDANAYFARWQLVKEHEREELKRTSIADKARQLESLFAARALFPLDDRSGEERSALIARWSQIRTNARG